MKVWWIVLWLFCQFDVVAQTEVIQEGNRLRLVSYNIHGAKGLDGIRDYDRIAGIILRTAPDVVALQEVDSVTQRSQGKDMLKELAGRTQMHAIYGAAIEYQGGKYGIGILAKEKPLKYYTLALPGREEKRVLLVAEFRHYVLLATHFSLTAADQLTTVPIVLNEARKYKKPVFLAGDLNAVPGSPTIVLLEEHFHSLLSYKDKTFPANRPTEYIDYILQYKGTGTTVKVLKEKVLKEKVASDHRPVLAEVVWMLE